jgi:ribosome biogenesis protein SSF1/2
MLISQTETSTNLRLAKFPNGPSLYFKIASYCLAKDILASQKNPKSPGLEFSVPPLLVLNNFDVDSSEGKLMCSMLQGLFPTINTAKVKLADIRRVALFNYDKETGLVELRHYLINVKVTGVSKVVKRIIRSEIPNLNDVADIGEYVLKAAAESESEYEQDSVVTLGQDYLGQANPKSSQRSVALTELGPRVSLKLVKIVDGFCAGETLYHANSQESNKASTSKNMLAKKKKQKQAKAKKTTSVIGN